MRTKQRPRLDRIFSKIKTLLVTASVPAPRTPLNTAWVARPVQLELDLGLKERPKI